MPAATGTPYGRWPGLAGAISPGSSAVRETGPVVVFADGPAHALAAWLDLHPGGDPAAALAEWCEAAQRLLRLAHGRPRQCVLVDVEEAARHPEALRALLAARFGVDCTRLASGATLPAVDPIALALAAGLIQQSRQAKVLHAQLQASCLPLLTADDAPDTIAESVDFGAALRGWQDHRREADERLLHLHQTQEELEALQRAQKVPHPAEALARRQAAEIDALRTALEAESRKLAEQATALAQATAESASLQRQLQAARSLGEEQGSELVTLRSACADLRKQIRVQSDAAARSRTEAELLQAQLHTVQEEMWHHHLALQTLEAMPLVASAAAQSSLQVDTIDIGESSHADQHHHLKFELRGVRTPHRSLPHLSVRLVEHQGRPGLVFLAPEEPELPLAAWHDSGEEAGRRFMALVPADEPSQRCLQRMATADWSFLDQLVAHLLHRLADDSAHPEAARWRAVARRLRQQLHQLPPRLRYSAITLAPEVMQGRSRLSVCFRDVVFGNDARDDLRLSWQPGGSHAAGPGAAPLLLMLDGDAGIPPLAAWPVDAQGRAAESVALPVGPGLSAAEKRRRWAALWPGDRELVLAVLDALPACSAHAGDAERAGLESGARALLRDALASQRQARWRRALGSVVRRLRG